ncbi:hypothetical protein ABXS75_10190 [Roseburia hominis]
MDNRIHIAICEDDQNQIEHISSIVSAWGRQNSYTCDIKIFYSAEEFLFEYEGVKIYGFWWLR